MRLQYTPQAAARICKKIIDTCSMLKNHPKAGASSQSKIDRETDFRYLIIGNYLAFCRITGSVISVAKILDGRQDYLRVLFLDSPANQ